MSYKCQNNSQTYLDLRSKFLQSFIVFSDCPIHYNLINAIAVQLGICWTKDNAWNLLTFDTFGQKKEKNNQRNSATKAMFVIRWRSMELDHNLHKKKFTIQIFTNAMEDKRIQDNYEHTMIT